MVGLSIVLESHQKTSTTSSSSSSCGGGGGGFTNSRAFVNNKVINKTNMILNKPSSSSSNPFFSPSYTTTTANLHSSSSSSFLPFLEHCFLCRQKLLPGKDIYMYKGDRGFCSVECRYRQIFMDEEDCLRKENNYCSFAAIKPTSATSSSNSRRQRKTSRNRAAA